jgi:LysR family transcriptional regulator, hydrogen peroxide-inducible genes activator
LVISRPGSFTARPPHPVSLRQLQYLVAVADSGSFRRAAAACHVSQPSLSAQVAQAERALGVRLFERDRRHVLPTPAADALLARARTLLLAADDLVAAASRLGDPLAGSLRIGVIPTIAPYLLPRIAPALRRNHPRLVVGWHEDRTAELASRLREGALDAALVALEAPLGDLDRVPIGDDPFLLCAPRRHPLAVERGPLPVAALAGADVLVLDEGHCLREQALEVCSRGRAQETQFRATSLATLVQMVAVGAGVTLLPQLAVAVERRAADVHIRRFAPPAPGRTIGLVFRARSALGDALRTLAQTLQKAYGRPRRAS